MARFNLATVVEPMIYEFAQTQSPNLLLLYTDSAGPDDALELAIASRIPAPNRRDWTVEALGSDDRGWDVWLLEHDPQP